MGLRYYMAEPPLDYHAELTKADHFGEQTLMVLGVMYKVMGGSFAALGVVLGLLTLFGAWSGLFWAKATIVSGAVIAGAISSGAARGVERSTGVRTPWRIAAALTGLAVIAFALSLMD